MSSLFHRVFSELEKGIRLSKCRKCGCMRGTLENLNVSLPSLKHSEAKNLIKNIKEFLAKLEPQEYPCFGCKYCIPAEAMTELTSKFPFLASSSLTSCEFEVSRNIWPTVSGEYTVLDKSAPVAVSVLASMKLEGKLSQSHPEGLCIVGKTETENIGIDKIVKNVIANPAISFLIVAGKDPEGHHSGNTLLSLWENGVDRNMRVINSTGRRPILKNVSLSEVNKFRKQIQIDNQMGCENVPILSKRIEELAGMVKPAKSAASCGCHSCCDEVKVITVPKIKAEKPQSIKLDRAGYFVIIPSKKNKIIIVEHYSYDNKLLRTIEGKNSRDIYFTIISNHWITDLSHAAYVGKELGKAELSIKKGFKFVQDGA